MHRGFVPEPQAAEPPARGATAIARRPTHTALGRSKRPEIRPRIPHALKTASPTRLIEAAAELAGRGAPLDALAVLAAALKASPRHPQGHALRLDLLRRVGPEKDLAAWLSSLRALYERAEASPTMILELALAEERLAEPDAAVSYYQEVVALGAVRAAPVELLEIAQAGVARCEAVLRAREAEASAAAESSARRARPKPEEDAPAPERARSEVLDGRSSMQMHAPAPRSRIELSWDWLPCASGDLAERLAGDAVDGLQHYRLAEIAWDLGLDALDPPELSDPPAAPRSWAEHEAAWLASDADGRALLAYPDPTAAESVLAEYLRREAGRAGLDTVLLLAPGPLLPRWAALLGAALPAGSLWLQGAPVPPGARRGGRVLLWDAADPEGAEGQLDAAPDCLLVDEAQAAASPESRLARCIARLAPPRLVLATGVPVSSDLLALHGLVTLLRPGLLGTASAFRKAHMERQDPFRASDPAALRALLAHCVRFACPAAGAPLAAAAPAAVLRTQPLGPSARDLPGGWAAAVCEALAWERSPGLALSRSPEAAATLRAELEARGVAGWRVACDQDPLPLASPAVRTLIHLDLPEHPAAGASRSQRSATPQTELLLVHPDLPELSLLPLGAEVAGLPAAGDARERLQVLARCSDNRPPLLRLLAATPAERSQALADIQRDVERARRKHERSRAASADLFAPAKEN